jgi:signal transduction histidine kinase
MAERIEERQRQNDALSRELQQQSRQRGLLLKRLITAQEDERIRVARELHDELGQSLTGLALRAQALERYVDEHGQGRAILEQMRALVEGTTEQMYEIIMALRPSVLDDLGLVSALRAYTERTLEGSDIDYTIDDTCFQARLPAAAETALFRAFQEGINNVVRHANASQLRIELACDGHRFRGTLEDDGQGFQRTAAQLNGQEGGGFGLLGMRERVTQCGGTMTIRSSPGAGTRIDFWIPLEGVFDASSD